MIIRILLLAVLLISAMQAANPEHTVPLPQLLKPDSIIVIDNKCFVSQKGSVFVFSMENGNIINRFGSRGSGPGEFQGVIRLHELNGHLMVCSLNKITVFSPEGRLMREMTGKFVKGVVAGGFQPFKNGFIGTASVSDGRTAYRTVNLYDKNLKFKQEFFRSPVGSSFNSKNGKNNFFKHAFSYRTLGNHIFVAGRKGFILDIFDLEGNSMSKISRKYEPIPFTKTDRRNFLKYLKDNSPVYVYQDMYRRIEFPEFYPVIFFLYSDKETLYVFTWKKSDKGLETFFYNPEGEFLAKKYLPIYFSGPLMFSPFTINNGKIYQLVEDEEEELWTLKITNIQ